MLVLPEWREPDESGNSASGAAGGIHYRTSPRERETIISLGSR